MNIEIARTYHLKGTNSVMKVNGVFISYTIELPWKENCKSISCIPEGTYEVKKRFSEKHENHLIVTGVKGRELILFHKANNALKELRGCIAPVTRLVGDGRGLNSKEPFDRLIILAYTAFENEEKVFLTIMKA